MIAADRGAVWRVVADPHHLPRWWPKVARVEDVLRARARRRARRWTEVLETASGKGVRAEFRCRRSREPDEYEWEQEIEDTPFAKVFKSSVTTVSLADDGGGTRVTLELDQDLRGLSRLGGFMVKRASTEQLDERARRARAGARWRPRVAEPERPMKWWGWGDPDHEAEIPEPALAALRSELGAPDRAGAAVPALEEIALPEPRR